MLPNASTDKRIATPEVVGIVAIGRNEGARLIGCLDSFAAAGAPAEIDTITRRTRTRARGGLRTARIASGGRGGGAPRPLEARAGVTDCSIAAQVRAATGAGLAEVRNPPPAPEVDVDVDVAVEPEDDALTPAAIPPPATDDATAADDASEP